MSVFPADLKARVSEIEDMIAKNEMTPAQVFTQMRTAYQAYWPSGEPTSFYIRCMMTHGQSLPWTECNREIYERFKGDPNWETRALYEEPPVGVTIKTNREAAAYRWILTKLQVGAVRTDLPLYSCLHVAIHEECVDVRDAERVIQVAMANDDTPNTYR